MNDPRGRYAGLKPITVSLADGRTVACVPRRFLPQEESIKAPGEFQVPANERLDQLSARLLGSADHGWMLADVNDAMALEALEHCAGKTIRIPLGSSGG